MHTSQGQQAIRIWNPEKTVSVILFPACPILLHTNLNLMKSVPSVGGLLNKRTEPYVQAIAKELLGFRVSPDRRGGTYPYDLEGA